MLSIQKTKFVVFVYLELVVVFGQQLHAGWDRSGTFSVGFGDGSTGPFGSRPKESKVRARREWTQIP
jgi:hypothetical protein